MWVSYDNLWLCYAGSIALILFLYIVKAVTLRYFHGTKAAGIAFAVAVALCVPVTWALSPDWDNRHVLRIGIYVGSPIATLVVPCISFLIDLGRRSAGQIGDWFWRVPIEVLFAVPLWFFLWVFFEFFILGWVWI